MKRTYTAQMSSSLDGGWCLYVVRYGESEWPEHVWPARTAVPTPAERLLALARLGFTPTPGPGGAEWSWAEYPEFDGDPTSPVRLLAVLSVQEVAR